MQLSNDRRVRAKKIRLLAVASLAVSLTMLSATGNAQDPMPSVVPQQQQSQQQQQQQQQQLQQQQPNFGQTLRDAFGRAVANPQREGDPNMFNQGPIVVPPISFIDVNSGRFGKLEIDLEDGQFHDASVDKLHLIARELDLNQGLLKSLDVDVNGGHFQDFTFDHLTMTTSGDMHFDTGILVNHKILRFTQPAQATVTATISQESLNKFINSPRTLDRLSVQVTKPGGLIANLIGGQPGAFGFNLTQGDIKLAKSNRILLNLETRVGVGQIGVPIPVAVNARLGLNEGWPEISDTQIQTAGQKLGPDISKLLVNKVNSLANWGKRNEDIHFNFTELKVVPGKQFILRGTAEVSQLRLTRMRT